MTADNPPPRRGDFVWLESTPQSGQEQAGRRPVLVLSPVEYNRRVGLALCCPITSRAKGYPFEVQVPTGCGVKGVVLADQVRSVDWRARRAERIGAAPAALISEVLGRFSTLLD